MATSAPPQAHPRDTGAEPAGAFARAALRARRRMALVRVLAILQPAIPALALVVTAGLLVARRTLVALQLVPGETAGGARVLEVAGVAGCLALCAGLCCLAAWIRRGSLRAAMARWDEARGGSEAFVAALEFESRPTSSRTAGEALHLRRAAGELERALAEWSATLPLAVRGRVWATLALPVLLLATDLGRAVATADGGEAEAAEATAAREVAGGIELEAAALTGLEELDAGELDEGETQAIARLRDQLRGSAVQLGDLTGSSRHEILQELEERANQAAGLAASLATDEEYARMHALIEELSRHADTAPLAEALRARNLEEAARRVAELAATLADGDLSAEVEQRIAQAFAEIVKSLDQKERRSLLGKHLTAASEKLQLKRPVEAAETLRELGRELARLAKRQRAARQLDRLADSLRAAGGRIYGGGRLKRLRNKGADTARLRNRYEAVAEPGASTWAGERLGRRGGSRRTPTRLAARGGRERPGGLGGDRGSPVPGSGERGAGQPGNGPPGAGEGTAEDGAFPIPGSEGSETAGTGTAPLVPGERPPAASGPVRTVDATPSAGPPGEIVPVAHGPESAGLESTALSVEFVRTEEAALAEDSLPPSRKELALWYLRALRRTLENE